MRHIPGLPYPLPDLGTSYNSQVERRHFNLWLEEISERPPRVMGVDFLPSEESGPSLGDRVRTTVDWAVVHGVPVQHAVVSRVGYTKTGVRLLFLFPVGPSLLPTEGVWLPADDVEAD